MIVQKLHHFAYRCKDAEQTRAFYEDVLELPLAHVIRSEAVPSTGEACPHVHIFFRMGDGSYMAFFDLGDDTATVPDPATPAWVNHIALEVNTEAELLTMKAKLEATGLEVIGPTDHGFVKSIYFFDPNGIRAELTYRTKPESYLQEQEQLAHKKLAQWTARPRNV